VNTRLYPRLADCATRRESIPGWMLAAAMLLLAGSALAQTYPARQITLVVPFAPEDRPISSADWWGRK
jgi:hypothetical protein